MGVLTLTFVCNSSGFGRSAEKTGCPTMATRLWACIHRAHQLLKKGHTLPVLPLVLSERIFTGPTHYKSKQEIEAPLFGE